MRVVILCVAAVWLWQAPSTDSKKPADTTSAAQEQAGGSASKSGNPVAATPDSLAAGKKTYGVDCAMCHGPKGGGDGDLAKQMTLDLKDLADPSTLKEKSDQELYEIIDKGKGRMIGEEGRLKPAQVWNVVNYVRAMSKKG
ncbi:MAG TPA: c-type cytochrome [Candidatus Eisenbacteria bacterium]|nr:c-type cytochrome [Candidatus Eisenbacteria bacterium]